MWNGVEVLCGSAALSGAIRELDSEVGSHLVLKQKEEEKYKISIIKNTALFQEELEDKNVETVFIDFEQPKFVASLEKGQKEKGKDGKEVTVKDFTVQNPYTEGFKETLLLADVDIKESKTIVEAPSRGGLGIFGSIIISFIVMFVVFFIFTRFISKSGGAQQKMMNEKTKAKFVAETPKKSFDDIAGYKTTKKEFETIVHLLKNPEVYKEMGAKTPKGAVLYGPPGTGKTLFAKAVAKEAGVPFFAISGSDFVEMFVGVGAARVRDLWKEARKHEKAIIFIDEIDAIGKKRGQGIGGGSDEREQTLNQILVELDGFGQEASNSTIFVIAATNRLDVLDDALIRPGRFDKHIMIPLPDKSERLAIIELYKKTKKFAKDVDFKFIAKKTIGFSGADLESLMNEAAILTVQRGSKEISTEIVNDAFYKIITKGDKKPKREREKEEEKDLELIAWHESGHGLASKLLTNDSIAELNIIPSTTGAGGMLISIPEKEGLHSREYFLKRVMVTYAGRAAEEILLGDKNKVTTGASNDIQQATERLLAYVKQYGFSNEYGMLDLTNPQLSKVNVEEEVKELAKKLYEDTLNLLTINKDKLEAIALALLDHEVLYEEDIDALIRGEEIPTREENELEKIFEDTSKQVPSLKPEIAFTKED